MIVSNDAPMLGSLTPDRWGDRFRRQDKIDNADWRKAQIKAARRAEDRLFASDLADELACVVEIITFADERRDGVPATTFHADRNGGFWA